MKKGFTLIELLAVIVILAIIIAIAVPTVLNIVDKSKSKSSEASKEIYLRAVEQAIATKNVKEEFNPTLCEVNEDGKLICTEGQEQEELLVEVSGTRPCKGSITIKNKEVASETLDFCDGGPITDPNDKEQEDELPKIFYSFFLTDGSTENLLKIGDSLPEDSSLDPPAGYNTYLKFESEDGKTVSAGYVCFKTDKEYCLKPFESEYGTNVEVLKKAFSEENCSITDDSGDLEYYCSDSFFREYEIIVRKDGTVGAVVDGFVCVGGHMTDKQSFGCSDW